ncbi:hypothetical protein SAMD00019534_104350, partial [Acytostelium subglobosum LB1]|uniref:hypothetical protein n=1 Tax=Acytostelium subglobosum LB1 TaxID=1410327 RepID=UPI000644A527
LEADPSLRSYADTHGEWENREISIMGAVKSFISQLSLGQELTKVSMPSIFLMPYSVLEIAASRYLKYIHLLSDAIHEPYPIRRMAVLVQYFLATLRDGNFTKKPYNALLGENHQCFVRYPSGEGDRPATARFLAEQVCHHPPLSCFYIETTEGISIECNVQFSAKFHMNSVSIVTSGSLIIALPVVGANNQVTKEVYIIDKGLPDAIVKNVIFGTRSIHWTDCVDIMCQASDTSATLHFDKNEFVKGDINVTNQEKGVEESQAYIGGYLNSIVNIEYLEGENATNACSIHWIDHQQKKIKKKLKSRKHHHSPTDTVLLDVSKLQACQSQYPRQPDQFASLNVWKEVTNYIIQGDMASSDAAKKDIEDEQRKRMKSTPTDQKDRQFFRYDEGLERWVFKGFPAVI